MQTRDVLLTSLPNTASPPSNTPTGFIYSEGGARYVTKSQAVQGSQSTTTMSRVKSVVFYAGPAIIALSVAAVVLTLLYFAMPPPILLPLTPAG